MLISLIPANSTLAMIHFYDYNFYIILGEITGRQLCAKKQFGEVARLPMLFVAFLAD